VSETAADPVAEYKQILQSVLERRPSGTRQRLAIALGKNRSFVSQIASPTYPVPIPAQHVDAIFEICHFSLAERAAFQAAYARAHPGRLRGQGTSPRMRTLTLSLPDLGDADRNRQMDEMMADFARRLARLVGDPMP